MIPISTSPFGTFASNSQRIATSYLYALAPQPADADASQRDLYAFFQAWYSGMAQDPAAYGLPTAPDAYIPDIRNPSTADKALVKKKLQKPRELIAQTLDILQAVGCAGTLEQETLTLSAAEFSACFAKPKTGRKLLAALHCAGLVVVETPEQVRLHNPRFPAMMPAFKALAAACAALAKDHVGVMAFVRCDLRALDAGYAPEALDLYRVFPLRDQLRLSDLHRYLAERGYKPEIQINPAGTWVVKYQGNKKIKATPLFQVQFEDFFHNPLRAYIKCASTNRVAPLVPQQSAALQADFAARVYRCRGAECNWCKDKKGMGPGVLEVNGEPTAVCWYSAPDLAELTDAAVALIKEYVELHAQL